jgi:hypothetical protein
VTLDYLVEDSPEVGPTQHLVMVTEEEMMILQIVRRLGSNVAFDRLVIVPPSAPAASHGAEPRGSSPVVGGRGSPESLRFDVGEDRSDV